MAVYERYIDNGYLITNLKEHAIYGSDRLGLDLNGVELSHLPIGEGDPTDPTGDPAGRHALVIGEILYDSPTTGDDFPAGKEYSEGGAEFSEFTELSEIGYKSGMDLDLSDYTLRLGEDSLVLSDSLLPILGTGLGERVIIGFGADMPRFQRITALSSEYSDAVNLQSTFGLPDRGGVLRVTHSGGNEIDELSYGAFYGLNAGNAYIADSLLDALGQRSSLTCVRRGSFGGQSSAEVSASEVEVGISDPGIEPEPSGRAVVGSHTLWRGRKVYDLKNHLGNVLAVVSDVKIGVGPTNVQPSLINYYTADVVEMSDYEPFGMLLAKRHWVSGEGYRFGFNGKEGDDEWNGDGNMYNYGFRIHDPRLGRFLSVDPLAPDYPELTTYQYASNCPIWMIDLDGLEGIQATTTQGLGFRATDAAAMPGRTMMRPTSQHRPTTCPTGFSPMAGQGAGAASYGSYYSPRYSELPMFQWHPGTTKLSIRSGIQFRLLDMASSMDYDHAKTYLEENRGYFSPAEFTAAQQYIRARLIYAQVEKLSTNPDDYSDAELLELEEAQRNGTLQPHHYAVLGRAGGRLSALHSPQPAPSSGENEPKGLEWKKIMTAKEVISELERHGFKKTGSKGSHAQYRLDGKFGRVTVPVHGGDVSLGTLRSIMDQAKDAFEQKNQNIK